MMRNFSEKILEKIKSTHFFIQ